METSKSLIVFLVGLVLLFVGIVSFATQNHTVGGCSKSWEEVVTTDLMPVLFVLGAMLCFLVATLDGKEDLENDKDGNSKN